MNESLKQRMATLLQALNERVYEKEQFVALALLTALAGESLFLLGPPGVAKSMMARRLKLAFRQGTAFEYLMSRFSTPDELFGPVSITRLKNEDVYERRTEGYLPSATVAFLDEIWKAGPAIQNTLLTLLNEKVFRNGASVVPVPLKGLIAASNELPAQGQGLEALWDRFLLRCLVGGVTDRGLFEELIASSDESEPQVEEQWQIGDDEYAEWQQRASEVQIPYTIFEFIHALKEEIEWYNQRLLNEGGTAASATSFGAVSGGASERGSAWGGAAYGGTAAYSSAPLYVSDRRWKKSVKLLRMSAFLNGSDSIRLSDCALLTFALWSEVDQWPVVEEMVQTAIRRSAEGYLLNLRPLEQDLEELKERLASHHSVREMDDPGIELIDSYYYQVEGVRMKERLLLFAADYRQLPTAEAQLFYLHKDKYKANCCILKKFDPVLHAQVPRSKLYKLQRGSRSVYINGYEYHLVCRPDAPPVPVAPPAEDFTQRFQTVRERLERVEAEAVAWSAAETAYAESHLFLGERERNFLRQLLRQQQVTLERYRHDLNELTDAHRIENEEYPHA